MRAPVQYVNEWGWDVLIVLDACRYDYFEVLNPFEGELLKLEVESSDTLNWLMMNFPFVYPYVYVSANPYVTKRVKVDGFCGGEHFDKVVEVWRWGWNYKFKTVPPWRVTWASLPYMKDRRVIVHYMQPHFPSIGKIKVRIEAWKPDPLNTVIEGVTYPKKMPPLELVREAYRENLEIVLKEIVKGLLPKIPRDRKVVITSDHGELLGENGMFFHPADVRHPALNTVFWLEIER